MDGGGRLTSALDVVLSRLSELVRSAGFTHEFDGTQFRLSQVGYANKSVDMSISLLDLHGVQLIEFESKIASAASFEAAALAVFEGNFRCRIVGFSAQELAGDPGHRFQVVARSHLYADHFSDAEFLSMLRLYTRELDEIDDELKKIVGEGNSSNG